MTKNRFSTNVFYT